MKVCVIQPKYSFDYKDADEYFEGFLSHLDACDESMDVIVMPEYSDFPTVVKTNEQFIETIKKFNQRMLQKAKETAIRCGATVFVNAADKHQKGYRNTTHAINKNGETVGKYYKMHPAPSEFKPVDKGGRDMDSSYIDEFTEPYIVEIDGVRYGFLTCYDFYFYEFYARLARENVDVIIGCSHQRSDLHRSFEVNASFLCYQTNAYLLRASVSLGEDSPFGGCSLICAPDGEILGNLKNEVGMLTCEIDPHKKYYKPAGFGGKDAAHFEYIEVGRRPQNYRPSGSAISRHNENMPYPRTCAHRGFNTVLPENTMAAWGAAVALGADEIEFDLWRTRDGKIVSCHDQSLERVSNGTGLVTDYTYDELLKFDFGAKKNEHFKGLKIALFEDILKKFSCHTIMNIHIKSPDNTNPLDEDYLKDIIKLIHRYDCVKHVYFMSGNDTVLKQLGELAPEIARCTGGGSEPWRIVERAIELGTQKVQLFKPYFNREMVELAHKNGILCNVFWSDDENETREFLEMGIDTILTNDYLRISNIVKEYKK